MQSGMLAGSRRSRTCRLRTLILRPRTPDSSPRPREDIPKLLAALAEAEGKLAEVRAAPSDTSADLVGRQQRIDIIIIISDEVKTN